MSDCKVDTKSYSTNDGLVIAQVAHIINFSAKCSGKADGKSDGMIGWII